MPNLVHKWDEGMKALIEAITGKRDLDADAPAVERVRVITGRIDPRLTTIPMSGRVDDLAEVKRLLLIQPVAVLGVGGLGKSRLAAEVVQTSDDAHGAIWHVASESSRADEVIDLLRDHFELAATTEPREVFKALREMPTLVVIDNAESVEAGDRRKAYAAVIEDVHAQRRAGFDHRARRMGLEGNCKRHYATDRSSFRLKMRSRLCLIWRAFLVRPT